MPSKFLVHSHVETFHFGFFVGQGDWAKVVVLDFCFSHGLLG